MDIQKMHEQVVAKKEKEPGKSTALFRLYRSSRGDWRAQWDWYPWAGGDTAEAAIVSAYQKAMEE